MPRTLSGKKLELPVKRILAGAAAADVASEGALADPGALDCFVRPRPVNDHISALCAIHVIFRLIVKPTIT